MHCISSFKCHDRSGLGRFTNGLITVTVCDQKWFPIIDIKKKQFIQITVALSHFVIYNSSILLVNNEACFVWMLFTCLYFYIVQKCTFTDNVVVGNHGGPTWVHGHGWMMRP